MHPPSSCRPPWILLLSSFASVLLPLLLPLSSSAAVAAAHNSSSSSSSSFHLLRFSLSDVSQLLALQRLAQIAAFQQFRDVRKTGVIYNFSVPSLPSDGEDAFQAIRLRSGSLARRGVNISDFHLPQGCKISGDASSSPPVRLLLVYVRLLNASLFPNLPDAAGFGAVAVNPPAVSLLAYDAAGILDENRSSSDALDPLPLTAEAAPISIRFAGPVSLCASFNQSTADVNYSQPAAGGGSGAEAACEATHLGTFASVGVVSPAANNRWKVVVGAVVGGVVVVVVVAVAAIVGRGAWRRAKVAKMQRKAEQEESLKSMRIRNSRAPAAADTRTLPSLERDYVT